MSSDGVAKLARAIQRIGHDETGKWPLYTRCLQVARTVVPPSNRHREEVAAKLWLEQAEALSLP